MVELRTFQTRKTCSEHGKVDVQEYEMFRQIGCHPLMGRIYGLQDTRKLSEVIFVWRCTYKFCSKHRDTVNDRRRSELSDYFLTIYDNKYIEKGKAYSPKISRCGTS
jgi:hypothetical protein